MDGFQRKWFEKGIETARRIVSGFDANTAHIVLAAVHKFIDDVAGDFDVNTFVESIARQLRKNSGVYPPTFDLHKVAVNLLVAATKIDRHRDSLIKQASQQTTSRDEITNSTEMLREIALDLAGVPYLLHECKKDDHFDENGECCFCKNNEVKTFQDRLYRDYITAEFGRLDSGNATYVKDALERLRNRFGDRGATDLDW